MKNNKNTILIIISFITLCFGIYYSNKQRKEIIKSNHSIEIELKTLNAELNRLK